MGNHLGRVSSKSNMSIGHIDAFTENSFKKLCGDCDYLTAEMVDTAFTPLVDPVMLTYIKKSYFGFGDQQACSVDIIPFQNHYYVAVSGTVTEKADFINTKFIGNLSDSDAAIDQKELFSIILAITRSFFKALEWKKTDEYESWKRLKGPIQPEELHKYCSTIMEDLLNAESISITALENWLRENPLWHDFWRISIVYAMGFHNRFADISPSAIRQPRFLPVCMTQANTRASSILQISNVMYLCQQLPSEYRNCWKLLFSARTDGESFSTLIGRIMEKGPTILIVQDESGHIFGGFATESWAYSPKFLGSETAFLFTLNPRMECYLSSGYNKHYQYLNINQQTLPNGLGMGGQFNYWGLWIDNDYGTGHSSETCSTFKNYKQMSAKKEFQIKELEVWAIGDEPEIITTHNTSILDTSADQRAILELAGRRMYSDGIREPKNE